MRRPNTVQQTYTRVLIDEVRACFGDESVEYGLALAGAPQLEKLLTDYTRERFDANDIVLVDGGHAADAAKDKINKASELLSRALWLIRVGALHKSIEDHLGPRPKVPTWLE